MSRYVHLIRQLRKPSLDDMKQKSRDFPKKYILIPVAKGDYLENKYSSSGTLIDYFTFLFSTALHNYTFIFCHCNHWIADDSIATKGKL